MAPPVAAAADIGPRHPRAHIPGTADADGDAEPPRTQLARFVITLATGFAIRAADGETREALLDVARCALAAFNVS